MRYFQGGPRQLPHSPHPISTTDSMAFYQNTKISRHTLILFTAHQYAAAHSLGNPDIRYCTTTWCYGHSVLLNKLQKICNKFINMIIYTNPAKKRNKEITKDNILNMQQFYKLNISICMYKSFHKQLPPAFNHIFQRKMSTVIIRSNSQILPI